MFSKAPSAPLTPSNGTAVRNNLLAMARRPEIVAVLIASLLQACMIGPDYKRPPAPLASKWEQAANPGVDTSHLAYADWWSVFNDPVLTRLVGIAYAQNLNLRTAGVRVSRLAHS